MPIEQVSDLNCFKPDFSEIAELSRKKEVVGIRAFALPDDSSEIDAICRNFAPLYGIDEESATGTANCALAGYFAKYIGRKEQYVFEQGYAMGLPSRIIVKAKYEEGEIAKIFVGGYGYLEKEQMFDLY